MAFTCVFGMHNIWLPINTFQNALLPVAVQLLTPRCNSTVPHVIENSMQEHPYKNLVILESAGKLHCHYTILQFGFSYNTKTLSQTFPPWMDPPLPKVKKTEPSPSDTMLFFID